MLVVAMRSNQSKGHLNNFSVTLKSARVCPKIINSYRYSMIYIIFGCKCHVAVSAVRRRLQRACMDHVQPACYWHVLCGFRMRIKINNACSENTMTRCQMLLSKCMLATFPLSVVSTACHEHWWQFNNLVFSGEPVDFAHDAACLHAADGSNII